MALVAGSASVNGSGVVSGTGLARDLYDADRLALGAGFDTAFFVDGVWDPEALGTLQRLAVKCTSQAAAIVAMVAAGDVRVPADAFDADSPPDETVLAGALE